MTPPIRVISKHYPEYVLFMEKAGLSPNSPDYRYISSEDQLRGLRCGIILVFASAGQRKDWPILKIYLQHLKDRMQILYILPEG